MIPALMALPPPYRAASADGALALVLARNADVRTRIAGLLLDAGFCVSTAATFGVVEVLLGAPETYDLVVVAQSLEETTLFGVPQLARSIDPDLPILVVDSGTAASPAIAELAEAALRRWPLRDRDEPCLH